jgi:hypothetical protein
VLTHIFLDWREGIMKRFAQVVGMVCSAAVVTLSGSAVADTVEGIQTEFRAEFKVPGESGLAGFAASSLVENIYSNVLELNFNTDLSYLEQYEFAKNDDYNYIYNFYTDGYVGGGYSIKNGVMLYEMYVWGRQYYLGTGVAEEYHYSLHYGYWHVHYDEVSNIIYHSDAPFDLVEWRTKIDATFPVSGYDIFDFENSWIDYAGSNLGPVSLAQIMENDVTSFLFHNGSIHLEWNSDIPISSITIAYAPVPEPETWAMLLTGLGLIGTIARRRAQKTA